MSNQAYLKTYFDEQSKVDPSEPFDFMDSEGNEHIMSYEIVIEAILGCPEDDGLAKIANTIRAIDFNNGDLGHFLRYLGRGLARRR